MTEKVGKIEIVIKGGQPWGFHLQAKAENRSVVIVDEIEQGGRADKQGQLKVGDHIIKINDIQCLSLADALQLIDSAFRTLTIVVWRTNNVCLKDPTNQPLNQMSCNSNSVTYNNSSTLALHENLKDFTLQDEKLRCDKKYLPQEKNCVLNDKNFMINSEQMYKNDFKVQSERSTSYKKDLRTPNTCLEKTFMNELERKSRILYSGRKNYSEVSDEIHQYSIDQNTAYGKQTCCDKINTEQNIDTLVVNSVSSYPGKEIFNSKISKHKNESLPIKTCDNYVVFQSPTIQSGNRTENCFVPEISDVQTEAKMQNSTSTLCHISNCFDNEKTNMNKSQSLSCQTIRSSNIYQNTAMCGQLNHFSYNSQVTEASNDTLYSFCHKSSSLNRSTLTCINKASYLEEKDVFVDASSNSLCMISKEAAVVKLISPRYHEEYMDEDDELKEIDKNRNFDSIFFSPNVSPPLPPPPQETETEILPFDEPLPAPPCFASGTKVEKGKELVETIYANLEMLKIQCSVVNSSSQTHTLQRKQSISSTGADLSFVKKSSQQLPTKYIDSELQVDTSFLEKLIQNPAEKFYKRILNIPFNSAYFTTSVPKAKLLTQYTSKLHAQSITGVKELSNEKEELISSIRKKLDILLQEEAALQDELQQNDELGHWLLEKLGKAAKHNEVKKFKNHVEELEKITNLLLFLSGRLARTKNALHNLPDETSAEEKKLLESKYKKLTQQYDEALHLQKNIDKRNNQVLFCLCNYFTKEELADYDHFIKMKVKLLIDYKELVEKIKLGEEQLKALTNS
ncbi:UNVERIFIED_CONTAM: shroom3 [Trichonephila clavipes]